ncbi:MAG: restriction endonuclease subunit S [Cellulosilyticum sp.]|nr:restriction endonuclease subunit S [Cellulosilyticum sp.]
MKSELTHMKIHELPIYISDGNYSSKYPTAEEMLDEGIPFVRANNLSGNIVELSDMKYISIHKHQELLKGHIKENDILICVRGDIGKTAVVPKELDDANINAQLALLRITDAKKVYYKYLLYAMKYDGFLMQVKQNQTGTALKQLPINKLKDLNIVVISIEKQIKIAEVLDKAQSLINKRKQQIQACNELIKSQFIEMFGDPLTNSKGWDVYNVSEVCTKITDGEHKNPEFISQGIPMVMANNVREYVVLDNCKYISQEDYDKFSKKCNPEYGDVLLVSRGATIGRCCKNNLKVHFALMGSVILLKPNNDVINADYLMAWFMQESIKPYIYQTSSATAQQAIYMKDLKEKRIILPPIKLQNEFAQFVQQVDKLKFGMEQSLRELEANFNSLMQRAFNGELF